MLHSLMNHLHLRRFTHSALSSLAGLEAREKKARRREFEQKQKDKKLHVASTQHTNVWYEATPGGIWVEHRRTSQEKEVRAKQKQAREGQAPYSPSLKGMTFTIL